MIRDNQNYYISQGYPCSVRSLDNSTYICPFPANYNSDLLSEICFAVSDDEVKKLVATITREMLVSYRQKSGDFDFGDKEFFSYFEKNR